MKISKREKTLLAILVLILLVFLYYQYVFTPLREQIGQYQLEKTQKIQQVMAQKTKIQNQGNLELRLKKAKEEMQPLVGKYFGDVAQEEFIVLLNQFADNSKLTLKRLDFTEQAAELAITPSAPPSESVEGQEGQEQPQEGEGEMPAPSEETLSALSNIALMSAKTEFEGDYSQFRSLLASMDDNPQRVISATLRLEKADTESPEDGSRVRGNITMDFYKVKDVEKYLTAPTESVLAMPYVEKGNKATPMDTYGWANVLKITDVPPVMSDPDNEPITQNINGVNVNLGPSKDTPIVPKSQLPMATQDMMRPPQLQKAILVPQPEQPAPIGGKLTEFKTVDGVEIGKGTSEAYATILHQPNQDDKNKGGALLNYAFVEKGKGTVDMNLMDKNLTLSQKPKSIDFEFYAQAGSGHKLIVVFKDNQNKDYIVHLSENINFSGWRTFELEEAYIPQMNYPVRIKSFLVQNNPGATLGASVLFGGISAAY